jgi:glycosyltransferase involved in cell wall biosynthesis
VRVGRNDTPLVTIAIPTFNRAGSYLPGALRAACHQSYTNLEILVSDNASSDATAELVKGHGDSRIRYHRQEQNIGSARNTNYCIDAARGEYTLLLNDDDLIDETFVEACIGALSAGERPGLIRTGMRIIGDDGATIRTHANQVGGLNFTQFVIAWTQGLTTPYLCNTLFKSEPLKASGMHSRHYLWDDVITELKIAATHGRVDIAEIHASSREHHGELTRAATVRAWTEDSLDLLELVCRLAPSDAKVLRSHLLPFLSELAYRRAAEVNANLGVRLYSGWEVYRTLGMRPRLPSWFKHVLSQESWYAYLVRAKHFSRSLVNRRRLSPPAHRL